METLELSDELKNFIKYNIEDIKKNDWKTVYSNLKISGIYYTEFPHLYEFLRDNGIDVLKLSDTIYYDQFQSNKTVESIEIPGNIKYIEHCAFADCMELKNVILPSSLTMIGAYVFQNCHNLETIEYNGSIDNFFNYSSFNCDNRAFDLIHPQKTVQFKCNDYNGDIQYLVDRMKGN